MSAQRHVRDSVVYSEHMTPPGPTSELKKRLLLISRINAWTVIGIAVLFGGVSLLMLSVSGVLVGVGLTGAGVLEITGHRRLGRGEPGAQARMTGSQVVLVLTVVAYCGWRLVVFDPAHPLAGLTELGPLLAAVSDMGLVDLAELQARVSWAYLLTYRLVAVLTLVLQGGLGLYYWRSVGTLEAQAARAPGP